MDRVLFNQLGSEAPQDEGDLRQICLTGQDFAHCAFGSPKWTPLLLSRGNAQGRLPLDPGKEQLP
jgi:hypothetical protein